MWRASAGAGAVIAVAPTTATVAKTPSAFFMATSSLGLSK
jgi:hypothetical protein